MTKGEKNKKKEQEIEETNNSEAERGKNITFPSRESEKVTSHILKALQECHVFPRAKCLDETNKKQNKKEGKKEIRNKHKSI